MLCRVVGSKAPLPCAGEPVRADSANSVSEGFRSDLVDPLETRPAVEITVEAQNRSNAMAFHDRNVHGVAGGQVRTILGDLPGTQDLRFLDWLLQDFRVSNQTLPGGNHLSRMTCASVLCGWAAPIRYTGMLESTKINPILARFHSASSPGPPWETSTCAPRRTAFNFVSGSITGRAARASRSTRRTHSPTIRRSRLAKRWMSDMSVSRSTT
jgi:hypothetical protein